jgi:hypothetical protein
MDIISLILIGITFITIISIQTIVWCQVIAGAASHYKMKQELRSIMPLKIMEKIREQEDDMHRGYT